MASASNPSLQLQLRNKDLGSKLKLICKGGLEAAAQLDPQLMAATAQIISQLTDGVPIASQISQVISFIVGTAAASFETSDKLKDVQKLTNLLQKNVQKLPTDDGEWQAWVRNDALPKLYAEAYSLNKSSQGCTCLYKLLCATQINAKLDRLLKTILDLNGVVNQLLIKVKQNQMLDRQEKPCIIAANLPASVDDILTGKDEVLKFLNIGKPGIRVLCIVGMGGVGKTTMLDALYNLILHKEPKIAMAKVEIGKDLVMTLTQIQQKIVSRLEGKNEDFDGAAQGQSRLERCFKTLKELDRPLCLCIDNVWKDKHLTDLFGYFGMYKNLPSSSYLIITTRTKKVAESFRCLFSSKAEECMEYNLQKLSPDKAEQLFRHYGEREGEDLNDGLVNTIVPLCDGLPLALRVYGTLFKMHEKEKTNYMNVATCIKEARDSDSNADNDDELFPALETSIDFQKEYVIEAFIDAVLFWRNRPYNEARHAFIGIRGRETRFDLDCLCEDSIIEQGKDGELKCHDLFVPLARKKAAERNWIYIDVKGTLISLNQHTRQYSLAISDLPSNFSGTVRAISTTGISCPFQILELLSQYFDLSDPRFISFMSGTLCNAALDNYFSGLQNLLALYITELEDYDRETKIQIQNLQLPHALTMLSIQFTSPVLPSSIGKLAALQLLDLHGCTALAALPASIGQLAALQSLSLRRCTALATLPASIGQLTALRSLDLCHCLALAALPASIGQLAALQSLDLHHCLALAALPASIGQLVALRLLDLGGCTALATLPTSIGQLAAVRTLDLGGCTALAALPASIGQLVAVRTLDLGGCTALTMLPASIGQLTAMESLDLRGCTTLAALPASIGQLAALQTLDLRDCLHLAVLPASIGQLAALRLLDLRGCIPLAALPASIGQLVALRSLDLRGCRSLAVLHASIGQLAALRSLDLRICVSLAVLPDSIGQLTALRTLDMGVCITLVVLPDSIGQLAALQTLDLSFCDALAVLPYSIGQLAALQTLYLHDCTTLAALPASIGQLAALQTLDLGRCIALTALPDSIGQLATLRTLDLHDCTALATLPASIGQLAAIRTLQLSDCVALATLPDSICQLATLWMLDLRNCVALAALPASIGQLAALQTLYLSGCDALAMLPESIGQLVALHTLDLHRCHALAALPDSIGQLTALQSLDLRCCRALAAVPDSICQLAALQSLDLRGCNALDLSSCNVQLAALPSLDLHIDNQTRI